MTPAQMDALIDTINAEIDQRVATALAVKGSTAAPASVLHRAYSVFDVKSADQSTGVIEGVASTPTTDRDGDRIEPKGAQFTLPLPLLWHHNQRQPIGHVTHAQVTDAGIKVVAQVAMDSGIAYVAEAWQQLRAGLVKGLSIGFRGIESQPIKGGGVHFLRWDWLELSAVTIAANQQASILAVKGAATAELAALGGGTFTRLDLYKALFEAMQANLRRNLQPLADRIRALEMDALERHRDE